MNKLLVVALLGCGSKDADRCPATVEKIMGKTPSGDGWARTSEAEKSKALAVRAEVGKAVTESCRTLSWSTEMHDCVANAEDSKAGLRACDDLLSPAQMTAVKDALMPKVVAPARPTKDPTTAVAEAEAKLAVIEQDKQKTVAELELLVAEVKAAKTEQAREQAQLRTAEIEKLVAALDERIVEAKAEVASAKRRKGVTVSKECLDNPLAKGC